MNWIFYTFDKMTNKSDIQQYLALLWCYTETPYLLTNLLTVVGGLGCVHRVGVVGRVGLSL